MEHVTIKLDDGTGKGFDAHVRGPGILPADGQVTIFTKDNATEGGQAAVLITFGVEWVDGTRAQAQTVLTRGLFHMIEQALRGRYGVPQ